MCFPFYASDRRGSKYFIKEKRKETCGFPAVCPGYTHTYTHILLLNSSKHPDVVIHKNLIVSSIDNQIEQMYYDGRRKLLEKQTRKNAFITCETEAVMEGGDCGGSAKGGNLP